MAYTEADLTVLLEIQQLDLDTRRATKRRDALPQRQKIIDLRTKKQEIEGKQKKVLHMRRGFDEQFVQLSAEDERWAQKQQEIQAKIDEVKGDYRSVESFTKELNGLSKRRLTLEQDLNVLDGKLDQIKALQTQVEKALANLEKSEQAAIASFQKEGRSINKEIADLEAQKAKLSKTIPSELLQKYEKGIEQNKGIAIGELIESTCSVCRNSLPEGKVLNARAEAPLSQCPLCKRMLVVK